jgi:magnesium-transporting ATPase (P-type)
VFFSKWVFWRWFIYAVWQGVLLCLIAFITLDSSSEKYGQMGGLSLEGNFIFAAIVIIANVKVLLSSYQYTIWICLLVFGSIGSFLVVFLLFSQWTFMSTTGEFEHTYGQLQTYITLCFFTLSYILIDHGMQLVGAELRYLDERRRTELDRIKAKANSKDKTLDKRRYTNYHHSGYAFSQE